MGADSVNNLSDNDIQALSDLVERIAAKPPEGSVTVVATAGGDDRFALAPEDRNGGMDLVTHLPDALNRFDYTSMDLGMEVKDLDFWPAEFAVVPG